MDSILMMKARALGGAISACRQSDPFLRVNPSTHLVYWNDHGEDTNGEANNQSTDDQHGDRNRTGLKSCTNNTARRAEHHRLFATPGVIHRSRSSRSDGRPCLKHGDDGANNGRSGFLEVIEEQCLSNGIGNDTWACQSSLSSPAPLSGHTAVIPKHES